MVANFSGHGVRVQAPADVRLVESVFSGNSDGAALSDGADSVASGNLHGFSAFGAAAQQGRLATRSTASHNQMGCVPTSGGLVSVGYRMASGNDVGFANIPGVPGLPFGGFETPRQQRGAAERRGDARRGHAGAADVAVNPCRSAALYRS